jgi:hypothetical protein
VVNAPRWTLCRPCRGDWLELDKSGGGALYTSQFEDANIIASSAPPAHCPHLAKASCARTGHSTTREAQSTDNRQRFVDANASTKQFEDG